jgi:hypothetical protein
MILPYDGRVFPIASFQGGVGCFWTRALFTQRRVDSRGLTTLRMEA